MIDVHTHLLPGVDDGSEHVEQTLIMARAAVAEGITAIVATPHHADGRYTNGAREVAELVGRVQDKLDAEGIPLTIRPGQEIRVHDDLLDAWQRGELLTLAGSRYMLLEMPSSRIPSRMGELLHELLLMGLVPVIAHPERNAEIARRPERLAEMIDRGAVAQVTTHSLLGAFGKQIEKSAWALCRSGLVHLVSSDAHHPEKRAFRLREAYEAIRSRMGEPWERYYRDNASCVAEDRVFGERPGLAEVSPSRGAFGRLFSFFQGN